MKDELLLLSEAEVRTLLPPRDVIETVESVFLSIARGNAIYGPIGRMTVDDKGRNFYMTFPTALKDLGIAGVKWFCGYGDPKPGYPFSHGNMLILADLETASPLALVGAGSITTMRTAGGHGVVAAKYLAVPEPKTLTVIGGGAQARDGIRGFLTQFPSLRKLNVYSLPVSSMESLRNLFGSEIEMELFTDPEPAVRAADILLAATTALDVLIRADWISPGTTVIAITAFTDLDPQIVDRADKWVLGNRIEDKHNIIENPSLRHGYPLKEEMAWADLSEIVSGSRPGRERADEIVVYSHMGMGFFDIACAKKAYDRALEKGIGQRFLLAEF